MNNAPTFNLHTATPEEIAAHVDQAMRAKKHNAIAKRQELSDLKFRMSSDGQLMLNVIDFERRGTGPEVLAAHRRYVQAEIDWLTAHPGDDLDAETIAFWVRLATEGLPHAAELASAVEWVKEVEEYQQGDTPSETLRKLQARLEDATGEIKRHLGYALTEPDAALLSDLGARSWRAKQRFKLIERRDYRQRKTWALRDVGLRAHYLFSQFEQSIERARTLGEVKRICAIWHTPARVEIRDGASWVIGDGFEISPL